MGGVVFFFKQKTAYEMRISDWSSDVCSSDLMGAFVGLVLSVLAIVVGVVLLVRSAFGNDDVSGARGVALDVTAPIAAAIGAPFRWAAAGVRSEEHTSELQSLMRISYAVFCLKKKKRTKSNERERRISMTKRLIYT